MRNKTVPAPVQDKPKCSGTWNPDPWWYGGSERFYQDALKGGVCRYCGATGKDGPMALCECHGLRAARAAYQDKIRREAGITPATGQARPAPVAVDNPDRNHEQATPYNTGPKEGPELPL